MKIVILHGDDTNKSYARLAKFIEVAKVRSWELNYLDDSPNTFEEDLSASSLFGSERFFILKNVRKLGKKEFAWFNKKYSELSGTLIIYNEGTLSATVIKSFPKESKVEEFKLPVLIWNFLDSLQPGSSQTALKSFHKIIEKDSPEFIFSLIARHFRDLFWVKTDAGSAGFPFWKINKLKSQSSKYSLKKLQEIITLLGDIDISVKTSKSDLVSELDLLIIKQLE